MNKETAELVDRLHYVTFKSCTCMTKTPEPERHLPSCNYRMFMESIKALEGMSKQVEDLKDNNKNLTKQNTFLRQRSDLPADRIPAYKELSKQVARYDEVVEYILYIIKESPDVMHTYPIPISESKLIDIKKVCKKALKIKRIAAMEKNDG